MIYNERTIRRRIKRAIESMCVGELFAVENSFLFIVFGIEN